MTDLSRRVASLSPEKRALLERRLARVPRAPEGAAGEPIAIIGMGCRFPGGADSPEGLWQLLSEGRDAVVRVPGDRWNADALDAEAPGLRWGGFLNAVDQFDPSFFSISPREAAQMDPQQRLLLEVAWEALEEAGQPAERVKGSSTGVFVGIHSQSSDYYWLQIGDRSTIDTYTASGGAHSIVANRLSYLLDLRGPSVAVDTACSSSLVAVHLACQSLRTGDCDMALAGGVNLMLSPAAGLTYAKMQMLAPDGRCKTFDASADGFGRGEGCGIIVLKRLTDAVRDADPVLALIRGTAVNQDGATNGLTAPSGLAQQAVIRRALVVAGVEAAAVSYVETHGTGTALGDPIEVEALTAVVGTPRQDGRPCVLGSVKANIGHLEGAAGIAGLIKVVLCLQNASIPGQPHYRTLNPHITLNGTPFVIPSSLTPWGPSGVRRIAGVSSFGFGGTNAHVVLEEAPVASGGVGASVCAVPASAAGPVLLPISARSEGALRDLASAYRERLGSGDYDAPEAFGDFCYSATVRRSHHDYRLAVAGCDARDCARRLQSFLADQASPQVARGRVEGERDCGPVFVFSGQGPQWSGMGREVLEAEPVFRNVIERCDALIQAAAGWSLVRELQAPEAASRLAETEVAQPALFALQVALAAMWRGWGIEPSAVIGHSLGEVAAAHIAGALSLEEAVRVVVHRGKIMQQATGLGKMAAVDLSGEEAAAAIADCRDRLTVGAVNAPSSTVLSGDPAALDAVLADLTTRGVRCQPLPVNYAFHSHQMEPLAEELVRALGRVSVQPGSVPMISTVTGRVLAAGEGDGAYWGRNVRQPVLFAAAVAKCLEANHDGFLEIGPHPVLSGAIVACLAARGRSGVVAASLRRRQPERMAMLSALGALHTGGFPVDWRKQHPAGGRCVQLPAYPWQRQRHWLARTPPGAPPPGGPSTERIGRPCRDTRLGSRLSSAIPTFQNRLNPDDFPSVRYHTIHGESILPLTVILELAVAAAQEALGAAPCAVEDLAIHRAVVWDPAEDRTLQLVLGPRQDGTVTFQLFSCGDGGDEDDPFAWILHASGEVHLGAGAEMSHVRRLTTATPEQVRARCRDEAAGTDLDAVMRAQGIECAVPDGGIETIWRGEGEALGRIRLPRESAASDGHRSSLLLAAFQLVFAITCEQAMGASGVTPLVPVGLESFRAAEAGKAAWVYARRRSDSESRSPGTVDLELWDASGDLIAQALGVQLAPLARQTLGVARKAPWQDWLYEIAWRPAALCCAEAEELARAIEGHFDWSGAPGIAEFEELDPLLEALSAAYIFEAVDALGMDLRSGSRLPPATSPEWRVVDRHRRLLGRLLEILGQQGILKKTPNGWGVVGKAPTDPEERRSRLLGKHPGFVAELTLLGRCGPRLAAVLRGDCDPLDLLFPGGSMETAERLYRDSPLFGAYNRILRDAVARAVSGIPRGKGARILEIGAGTGGTTVHLLSALPVDRTEYVFSDVSPLFVERAKERFQAYDFMRYTVLDIERDPEGQGLTPHSFDIVIASNVLHATRDMREALQHTARLLAPGGLLILFEVTARQGWVDLTFGLTEGWWRFADHGVRHDYPLLTLPQWDGVLRDLGFRRPGAIVGPNGVQTKARQAVLLAGAPETGRMASRDGGRVSSVDARRSWLLLANPGGVAEALAGRLTGRGEPCQVVGPHDDVAERVKTLAGEGAAIIVDLRAVGGIPVGRADSLEAACEQLLVSAVSLVQSVVRIGNPQVRLWIVTQGAQAAGEERVGQPDVAQAALWGLGRGINLEHPECWAGLVDLDQTGDPAVDLDLLLEVLTNSAGEDQIALRRGMALVPRLLRTSAEPEAALAVRADATYLISGGLGGLGLEVARWLVGRGARHLVLTTRRGLPDRRAWAELPEGSEESRRARGVLALETAGASVSVVSADVADHTAMAALIEGLERSQTPLRGIIHAAADLRRCQVDHLDRAILQAMLRPKIGGALVLHELTQKLGLDFFVLFSSTAAVWGAAGWAHYGAGNSALDALAHARRRQGLPGLSVNWGTWATMRVFSPEERAQVERFGLRPMQTEEALAALGAVLGGASPQRVVAAVDWERLRSAFEARRPLPLLMEIDTPTPKSHVKPRAARPGKDLLFEQLASAAPAERLAILAEHVAGHVGKALGLDARAVDHSRGFFDMGMDSLTSAELRRSLEARLGHSLSATLVFNYPTVAALTAYLAAEILPLLGLPVEATAETVPFATSSAESRADEAVSDEADARLSEGDLLARLRSKLQKLR